MAANMDTVGTFEMAKALGKVCSIVCGVKCSLGQGLSNVLLYMVF